MSVTFLTLHLQISQSTHAADCMKALTSSNVDLGH